MSGGAEVGLDGLVAGEGLISFLIGDGSGDDDVVALFPVGGGGDLVIGRELHGVEDPKDLVEVAAGGHGIAELQLDFLVGADDEDGADGGIKPEYPALPKGSRMASNESVVLPRWRVLCSVRKSLFQLSN